MREEIDALQRLAAEARRIGVDTKSQTLLRALDIGFEQMATTGAARKALAFDLDRPPREDIPRGRYHLISKSQPLEADGGAGEPSRFLYRLSHPLGERVIEQGKAVATPAAEIAFDVTSHPARLAVVEARRGQRGHLTLSRRWAVA